MKLSQLNAMIQVTEEVLISIFKTIDTYEPAGEECTYDKSSPTGPDKIRYASLVGEVERQTTILKNLITIRHMVAFLV